MALYTTKSMLKNEQQQNKIAVHNDAFKFMNEKDSGHLTATPYSVCYFELSILRSFCRLSNMTQCPLPSKTSKHALGTALTRR